MFASTVVACGGSGEGSELPTATNPPNETATVAAAPQPTATHAPTSTPEIEVEEVEDEETPETDFSDLFSDDAERSRVATLQKIWSWKTNFDHRTIPSPSYR